MLQRAETTAPSFSLAQARHIVADLFAPKAWIYWADFLVSAIVGYACVNLPLAALRDWPQFLPGQSLAVRITVPLLGYVAAALLFYRMSMFIHELAHMRAGTMNGFRLVWNLLCGIPFLMPSFVYYTHMDHHRRKHFGTERDGEYLPFTDEGHGSMIWHVLASFVIPPLVVARFLIVGPISWFVPLLRRWVLAHGSSMIIDYKYIRPQPSAREARVILLQEVACLTYLLALLVVPPLFLNRIAYPAMIVTYALGVFILTLNAIRTLGAHRYSHDGHAEMSFVDQLLESTNMHRRPYIAELWGPVGTRYHALHHLFPALPYHAMPEAHRRLMAQLPSDSAYHQTEEPSLTSALID